MEPLFEVRNLKKYFPIRRNFFSRTNPGIVKAIDDISFRVLPQDIFGIVGESGCGKTTLLQTMLTLHEPTAGELFFNGNDITNMTRKQSRDYKSQVQTVMQDPYSSLSPRLKVRDIIAEPLEINSKMGRKEIDEKVIDLLKIVKLDEYAADCYPHEFSGGQRQRIAIARSISINPNLLLLDEPVSALDVSVQSQLMNELMDLQQLFKYTYVVVAHDLAVIRFMCNRMMVMYLGQIVEYGSCNRIFDMQLHPYTQALFQAALPPDPYLAKNVKAIQGEIPSPINPPGGCRFHSRCPYVLDLCREIEPKTEVASSDHRVKCHRWRKFS